MNFGGISKAEFSEFENARILVFPVSCEDTVSPETETAKGAAAIIDASRGMELYEEETDSEAYKIGIHTLEEFNFRPTPETMMNALYERTRELLKSEKFICTLGGEHSISVPVIRAHVEKFHNLSVLQIDAHADLRDEYNGTPHSRRSVMARVIKDLRVPSVQVGIRSISADEAQSVADGISTKIYWAKYIVGRTDWIDDAIGDLTENVYLTIDVSGLDPSLISMGAASEPGGLGWYETLVLIRKLAAQRRIVGMDLVEFSPVENQKAQAFLCAKLVYKSLAYIFRQETPKVIGVI
jgi:agmatinase